MRYSNLFGKTTRTAPRNVMATSHKLLYRGGFIRQISTGRYSFLPLGFKVWSKILGIIDNEMQAMGCQRLIVPTFQPINIWQVTNRDKAFGKEMHIIDDHHGATFAIGATAEGVMVELVKKFRPSYKDLPWLVYQFSQKFRDDKRPRGGLLRVREFMMKDAYSFCQTEAESLTVYQKFYDAYLQIADRLDLKVIPVEANSGAIGGDYNHEFIVLSGAGESSIFVCDKCDYAASSERIEFRREDLTPGEEEKPFEIIDQPAWVKTMDDNVRHYGEPLHRYLKNVVYKNSQGDIIVASIRGDQDVNEAKLAQALGEDVLESASDEDLVRLGTKPGYVPSWGLEGATFVGDIGLTRVKNFIGGQKSETTDSKNVNYGRDFEYELLVDIVDAKDGDRCVKCGGVLHEKRGIEFGHCFKQDHFYTKPQEGCFVDDRGQEKFLWMGAYGIGIGRAMAAVVETHHDERGIVWPVTVAPYQVHFSSLNVDDPAVSEEAEKVYRGLLERGIEVLYDDREESAGVKFADADLIGIPRRVVVSRSSLEKGGLEIKNRSESSVGIITLEELFQLLEV